VKIARRLIICLSTFVLIGQPLVAAPSKSAGLRLDPATTLPGLPVGFLITLPDDVLAKAVEQDVNELPARLHVTAADGKTFEAAFDDEANFNGWISLFMRSQPAHGIVQIQELVDPPLGPGWFADLRFQQPGTYRLRFEFLTTELGMSEDLRSSEATLVVREPQGVDAAAWTWLRAQAERKGGWKRISWVDGGVDLIRQLTDRYPTSEYARYGVGMLTRNERDQEGWLEKAIQLSEGTWLADLYRINLEGRRARRDPSCGERPFAFPSSEQTNCMMRVNADVREHLRLIGEKTTSPSVRHLSEIARGRLEEEARNLSVKRQ
jgi:hypothetical protein